MEPQLFQDAVDPICSFIVLVDPVEDILCGLYRRRRDADALAMRRDSGNPRGNMDTDTPGLS